MYGEEGISHVPSWLSISLCSSLIQGPLFQLERVPSPDHRRRSYRDSDKPRLALPHCAIGGVGVGLPEGKALGIGIFQGYFKPLECSLDFMEGKC